MSKAPFEINMKVEDLLKTLDDFRNHAKERNFDLYSRTCIDEIGEAVLGLAYALQFYANKNYDSGLVARITLGQMNRDDEQSYAIHADNTQNLVSRDPQN